jgi:pimeloyl-ACP methyl ester carboxylesterase
VLLVHGIGANHRNLDAEPERSLARLLHESGRDVWLLTLRSGRSDRRLLEHRKVRFRSMVDHDLPLAVEEILARTKATSIDFVGFSMGGMLLYAAFTRQLAEAKIRRVAIIGSPGLIWPPIRWLRHAPVAVGLIIPHLPLRFLSRMFAFVAEHLRTPLHRVIYNPTNVAPGSVACAMVNMIADVPRAHVGDFTTWALTSGELVIVGERVLDRLADIRTPALFIAGGGDKLAPPHAVEAAFEAWGHATDVEKEIIVLSREAGARADYGHGDLAMGRHVVEDVFEPIVRFLARRP